MAHPLLRPVGFRPWEISAIVCQDIIDEHAEEAAFLWTQRDRAAVAAHYALKDLARLDERVEAHVDGLRVAGVAGWKTVFANLEQGPGEVFAASVLAFESGDAERRAAVLPVACSAPALGRALASGVGWMEPATAIAVAEELAASGESEVRRAGIAALAIHRHSSSLFDAAIADAAPRVAARALRAAGELGRVDLTSSVSDRLDDRDGECRFWSAWSTVRLRGVRLSSALGALREFVDSNDPRGEQAAAIAFRVVGLHEGHAWRQRLAVDPATARIAAGAAGAMGDPAAIPDLLDQMQNPELARVSGQAFSLITGADFEYEDLSGQPPAIAHGDADDEDTLLSGPDADLLWPSPRAIQRWWFSHADRFVSGTRYLLGQPISTASLRGALVRGRQSQRAAAALELALLHPTEPLFETRERAQRQRRRLLQWNS
jgi:uncharacterized protein (TIGR02270 family)